MMTSSHNSSTYHHRTSHFGIPLVWCTCAANMSIVSHQNIEDCCPCTAWFSVSSIGRGRIGMCRRCTWIVVGRRIGRWCRLCWLGGTCFGAMSRSRRVCTCPWCLCKCSLPARRFVWVGRWFRISVFRCCIWRPRRTFDICQGWSCSREFI